jgi:hypothetical protein
VAVLEIEVKAASSVDTQAVPILSYLFLATLKVFSTLLYWNFLAEHALRSNAHETDRVLLDSLFLLRTLSRQYTGTSGFWNLGPLSPHTASPREGGLRIPVQYCTYNYS